ncbi:MAG: 3-phosphoshikimate 1-carboxyvinyltransferase [Gemmatimonadales bacterium]|nr:3-phosphoshikimate 1-carboxyvinyltransferase [Gemmatimonadota bacterium]MCL4214266.1 3-phosphoshikimate 1-carboxyvinyltransferase [Gemmatimonadales bacterium]
MRVPGDKSISHRALMLAALGSGRSRIRGLLCSADIESTAGVLRALGAIIPPLDSAEVVVEGLGLRGLRAPAADLDCGNSGTSTRLLAGIVAGAGLHARFTGDASLSARPMRRVARPLEAMGARVELAEHGGLPMTVRGGPLRGLTWHSEVASAQVKSAILLAGLVADVPVEVHEPAATRDHTERMLRARGADIRTDGLAVSFVPGARLDAADTEVPGDPSSAAFFAGLAALGASEPLTIEAISVNPLRIGALRVLRRMGARVTYGASAEQGGESVASVTVGPSALRGVTIAADEVPALIDELPLLACVAARAEGETRVTGAEELRVKESDRIRAIVANLRALGADAEELPDGLVVRGSDRPLRGTVRTHADHRIAMAFGVLGAVAGNDVTIDDPSCASVSYPTFWDDLARHRQR